MERESRHNLEILTELARGTRVTQRGLAQKLGIALGLANLYLKRLARKGYIKISTIPRSRIRYLLTPKGIVEKTRLTYEYMEYSLKLYRETRHALFEGLRPHVSQGHKLRVALYGTTEAAELAFLTLRELGLEITTVVAGEDGQRDTFLGLTVCLLSEVDPQDLDLVIVASFTPAREALQALASHGIPRERVISVVGVRG